VAIADRIEDARIFWIGDKSSSREGRTKKTSKTRNKQARIDDSSTENHQTNKTTTKTYRRDHKTAETLKTTGTRTRAI
jgi:hypothetical protein